MEGSAVCAGAFTPMQYLTSNMILHQKHNWVINSKRSLMLATWSVSLWITLVSCFILFIYLFYCFQFFVNCLNYYTVTVQCPMCRRLAASGTHAEQRWFSEWPESFPAFSFEVLVKAFLKNFHFWFLYNCCVTAERVWLRHSAGREITSPFRGGKMSGWIRASHEAQVQKQATLGLGKVEMTLQPSHTQTLIVLHSPKTQVTRLIEVFFFFLNCSWAWEFKRMRITPSLQVV